jgi:magnesium chelatase family protein
LNIFRPKILSENKNKNLVYFKIKGQNHVKRGLEISAAGKHHVMLCGSPGTGKTFLAKTIQDILPELKYSESLDCSIIRSVTEDLTLKKLSNLRPWRSPHHSSTYGSIIGGGSNKIKPGEITLAHHGLLFMDEFPEFKREIIEALRQPLEDKHISISRAHSKVVYPADFTMLATMNPCPCGYYKSNRKKCICTVNEIKRYQKKISGPILDRIDLWINLDEVDYEKLINKKINTSKNEVSEFLKNIKRVRELNDKQNEKNNYESADLNEINIKISKKLKIKLNLIAKKLNLSARSYFKIIKISKTIAQLENSKEIKEKHLMEALQYRANQ